MARDKVYGQPIHSVSSDFSTLGKSSSGTQELEMRRSVKSEIGYKNLNIRISALLDRDNQPSSHLIIWRDVTQRKLADEARQRARGEMFVLLNAISSAASNAMNLEDFLSESIYQIIYPFRCQSVAIFLMSEKSKKNEILEAYQELLSKIEENKQVSHQEIKKKQDSGI